MLSFPSPWLFCDYQSVLHPTTFFTQSQAFPVLTGGISFILDTHITNLTVLVNVPPYSISNQQTLWLHLGNISNPITSPFVLLPLWPGHQGLSCPTQQTLCLHPSLSATASALLAHKQGAPNPLQESSKAPPSLRTKSKVLTMLCKVLDPHLSTPVLRSVRLGLSPDGPSIWASFYQTFPLTISSAWC